MSSTSKAQTQNSSTNEESYSNARTASSFQYTMPITQRRPYFKVHHEATELEVANS